MIPRDDDAGPAPRAPDPGDDRDLAGRLVVGPLAATAAEVDDALALLAALLLDAHAARAARGDSPNPSSPSSENGRPDAQRREARSVAPPAGGAAA